MHTLQLNVSDMLYQDVISFLNRFPKSQLSIKEINPDFIVQNIDDAKSRITNALNNNTYTSHDEFWNEMDVYTHSL